jgi:hypothetical protein
MSAHSGHTTVTTAGTEVVLGTGTFQRSLAVKALSTNTGIIYIGNAGDGTVSSSTGFELLASDVIVFEYVHQLNDILVDASINAQGVSWLALKI